MGLSSDLIKSLLGAGNMKNAFLRLKMRDGSGSRESQGPMVMPSRKAVEKYCSAPAEAEPSRSLNFTSRRPQY